MIWFEELKKEKDACYRKVRSRYKKWPSAYASGALVQCRKVGAKNWGNSVKKGGDDYKPRVITSRDGKKYLFISPERAYPYIPNHPILGDKTGGKQRGAMLKTVSKDSLLKGGDNFAREKKEGLHGWFSRRGGDGQKGWVSCQSCEDDKKGTKPCGRKDASKGTKQRCRPTCSACKTYKRRKGNKRSRGRGFTR